ncbi:transposase [Salicibibacter halophilus]
MLFYWRTLDISQHILCIASDGGYNDQTCLQLKQRKFIKYNHLVSNCLIFYNVFSLSRILQDYTQEGHEYDNKLISYLSPYVTAHVNRFGRYRIDLNRKPPELPFDISVAQSKGISPI